MKRLEYASTQLDELVDQYALNLRLREGTQTLAHAFLQSDGSHKKNSLNTVRSGYIECTETLVELESKIEEMMGHFQIHMKGNKIITNYDQRILNTPWKYSGTIE